jgi:hypothetical protein
MMMLAVPRCLYQIEILQAELAAIRAEPSAREACAIDNQRPVEEVDLTAVDECSLWAQWQWVKGNGATATGKRETAMATIDQSIAMRHWGTGQGQWCRSNRSNGAKEWGNGNGDRSLPLRSINCVGVGGRGARAWATFIPSVYLKNLLFSEWQKEVQIRVTYLFDYFDYNLFGIKLVNALML